MDSHHTLELSTSMHDPTRATQDELGVDHSDSLTQMEVRTLHQVCIKKQNISRLP